MDIQLGSDEIAKCEQHPSQQEQQREELSFPEFFVISLKEQPVEVKRKEDEWLFDSVAEDLVAADDEFVLLSGRGVNIFREKSWQYNDECHCKHEHTQVEHYGNGQS